MKQPWKNTSPCYGFLLLGHWPQQLSAATCAQKQNIPQKTPHTFKHFKRCLGITLATMTDLQADNGVDCHQGFYQYQYRSFALTKKDTWHKWLFLTTALPESSSIFFQPVTMLVSTMFLLSVRNVPSVWSCDHFSFVACFNLSSQHCRLWLCSSLPVFITDGARSVNN